VAAVVLACAGSAQGATAVYEAFDADLTSDYWSQFVAPGGPRRYITIEYSGIRLLEPLTAVGTDFKGLFWYYSPWANHWNPRFQSYKIEGNDLAAQSGCRMGQACFQERVPGKITVAALPPLNTGSVQECHEATSEKTCLEEWLEATTNIDLNYERTGGPAYIRIKVQDFAAGVPEPSTWAMLIAGFGLVGAAVRRRRAFAAGASSHA
jgi:hypothetical protein